MANIPGFPGYAGWGQTEAEADFRATGGAGKGPQNGGGGSASPGGSGFTPLSMPDLAALRTQIAGTIHPYYEKLAQLANGNFDEAVKIMTGDYQKGVKVAKENLAYSEKYGIGDLKNALGSLGLSFNAEDQKLVDSLNQRGMAVYDQGPNNQPNVVTPTTQGAGYSPTYDTSNYTFTNGVNASPTESLGRGGYESGQLRQDQALRSEALLRSKMQPLEQAGLTYKQTTNPNGFDPSRPLDYKGDMSQLGSSELNLMQNYRPEKNTLTSTLARIPQQEQQDINSTAQLYASTGTKQLDTTAKNQLLQNYSTDFLKGGV